MKELTCMESTGICGGQATGAAQAAGSFFRLGVEVQTDRIHLSGQILKSLSKESLPQSGGTSGAGIDDLLGAIFS